MKKTTSQVDEMQEEYYRYHKTCPHNKGYGHEIDDSTGCDCDCFCVICGIRQSPSFFDKRKVDE